MGKQSWLPFAGGIVVCAVLAGCSGGRCKQRGWIGGDLKRVQACAGFLECPPPSTTPRAVVGMPQSAGTRQGLLVVRAPAASPLSEAGVVTGDLIVALDGKPVSDPLAFRQAIEARPPGSPAILEVWRDGAHAPHAVVVGRETYSRRTKVGAYLGFSAHADLWPFDDGINVFGLVVAKAKPARHDIATVEHDYLARAVPGRSPPRVVQETVDVHVLPLLVGTLTEIERQETVALAAR